MSNIKLYLIKFAVLECGKIGIAEVAAESAKKAQEILQADGKYNGYKYAMEYPELVHTTDTFTAEALISELDNPAGEKGDRGPRGFTGPQGPKGEKGDPLTWEKMDPEDKMTFKEDAVADVESEIKTKYYPNMSVGMADNLVGRGDTQKAYINFRPSAGADNITDGAARIERIKGNSVVYNQRLGSIANNGWSVSYPTYASSNLSDGAIRVTVNDGVTISNVYQVGIRNNKTGMRSHRYLVRAKVRISAIYAQSSYNFVFEYSSNNVYMQPAITTPNEWVDISLFFDGKENSSTNLYIKPPLLFNKAVSGDWYEVKDATLIDLTQMFGADNEPDTVEEYHQRKPMNIEDEYAYNTGTLVDMKVESLISTSDNAYNSEIGFARVIGGVRYDISDSVGTKGLFVEYWNDDNGVPETQEVLTDERGQQYCIFPKNGYCSVNNAVGDIGICLNHSYHKDIKPHQQVSKDLSWIWEITDENGELLFPEGMRSAGSAYDEIRFNPTTKKWEAVKRIGEAKVGDLVWVYTGNEGQQRFTSYSLQNKIVPASGVDKVGNITSDKYTAITHNMMYNNANDMGISAHTGGSIAVKHLAYTNATTFKNEMADVIIYYELAKPIVVELDYPTAETNMDYLVWDFGTEEAIASYGDDDQPIVSAPFRADINYEPNAVDDLRWAVSEIRKLKAQIAEMQSAQVSETSLIE